MTNQWKIDEKLGKEVQARVENYTDEKKQILWDKIKSELKMYDVFTGIIFVKTHFGVFLDIGKEFPALLRVIDMKNFPLEDYDSYINNEVYKLGEELTVYFLYMHSDPDKIGVIEDIERYKRLTKDDLFS